jgi:hypothetical protein
MTTQEKTALAMFRCGCSFAEAAESACLDVAYVIQLWEKTRAKRD